MKNKIFFVEDDENIYELIEATLAVSDYETKGFIEPLSLLEEIKTNIPDLIILDLMLPNMSGYDVIKNIKSKKNLEDISIIILSAKSSELDIVKGLDLGADDYITKPFGILEFSSRIKANLRKNSTKKDVNEIIKIRGLEINNAKHRCTLNGEVVDLTVTEYQIVELLMKNVATVLTRQKILNIIWGYDYLTDTRTLDMHVKAIREKFSQITSEKYIETVRGIGYIINDKE